MRKDLGLLLFGAVAFWAVTAYPARRLWGDAVPVYTATALALCLVPTALTLLWSRRALRQDGAQQLLAVFGGTGLRMAVVLAGGAALSASAPYFRHWAFWVAVLVSYLFLLALEIALLVGRPAAESETRGKE